MKARLGSAERRDAQSGSGEGRGGWLSTHPFCLGLASSARASRRGERGSHCGWTAALPGRPYEHADAEREREKEREREERERKNRGGSVVEYHSKTMNYG